MTEAPFFGRRTLVPITTTRRSSRIRNRLFPAERSDGRGSSRNPSNMGGSLPTSMLYFWIKRDMSGKVECVDGRLTDASIVAQGKGWAIARSDFSDDVSRIPAYKRIRLRPAKKNIRKRVTMSSTFCVFVVTLRTASTYSPIGFVARHLAGRESGFKTS